MSKDDTEENIPSRTNFFAAAYAPVLLAPSAVAKDTEGRLI